MKRVIGIILLVILCYSIGFASHMVVNEMVVGEYHYEDQKICYYPERQSLTELEDTKMQEYCHYKTDIQWGHFCK